MISIYLDFCHFCVRATATPEFPFWESIKAYLNLSWASMKPVFAMCFTALRTNGNRGNEAGWVGDWETNHQTKSSDYGCAGLSMDLLDYSPRQR